MYEGCLKSYFSRLKFKFYMRGQEGDKSRLISRKRQIIVLSILLPY